MSVHIITTGGTIDKVYFDARSEYQIGEPVITELLHRMNVGFDFTVEALMRKDSLEITDSDRALIRRCVEKAAADKVLITHGTDTMTETAKALQSIHGKCVVLTGALQPAAFYQTDAVFNVGCALGALHSKLPGVYVAMSGQVFDADAVVKNRAANRFELRADVD